MRVLGEHSVAEEDGEPVPWEKEWVQLQGSYLYYNAPNCAYSAYCFIGLAIVKLDLDVLRSSPEADEDWFTSYSHLVDEIGTSARLPPLALHGDRVLIGPNALLLDVADRAEPTPLSCASVEREREREGGRPLLPFPECGNSGGEAAVAAQRCGEAPDCLALAGVGGRERERETALFFLAALFSFLFMGSFL